MDRTGHRQHTMARKRPAHTGQSSHRPQTDTGSQPVVKAAHSHRHEVTSTEGQHIHKEVLVHPDDRCRGITHRLQPANSSRQRQQTHTQ